MKQEPTTHYSFVTKFHAMSCCPPTALPPLPTTSDLKPTKMGSADVFFFDNPASDRCVLVFPDVFGVDSGRTKENCVKLSAYFKVALIEMDSAGDFPDPMAGTPWMWPFDWLRQLLAMFPVMKWIKARPFETAIRPKIDDTIQHLKAQHGVTKFAAIGYCWGAWMVAKYSTVEATDIVCGVSFHPSWRAEDVYHGTGSGAKLAEVVRVPQLVLSAIDDPNWLHPGGKVDKLLQKKPFASKVRLFSDVNHGWVNRGDLSNPVVAEAVRQAWDVEAVPFLQKHLQ
ncbi:Aste57867_1848 [Aphanomyces stellatus]|uniref:Aste57867_1848 protein n=1 Tax=Aphanomyces stellatus TaxID=120398 RepID=A0A485K8S8_9STRA|nr:hypothetical protein As57867_001846 [Aphanomyces stellatus]VFT79055.1 Aste57867_1848 [Aphanomyces stellatus]